MTYKIISTRQVDESLFTTVEYNFDGTMVTTEVAHFMPKSQDEVIQNIINRAASEQVKIAASFLITAIVPTLPIGEQNSL
jgi:lactam utilization protein B